MKNLLNYLLNWVLKKGSSETKKNQDHPISLRAIRYAAVLFMVFMVGIGNVWG